MVWCHFALINVVYHNPHLFLIQFNYALNVFLFSQNFISSCNHGHFSYLWKLTIDVLLQVHFEFFDDLLEIREVHFLDPGQNKKRLISHVRMQLLGSLICFCFENRSIGPTVVRDSRRIWSAAPWRFFKFWF